MKRYLTLRNLAMLLPVLLLRLPIVGVLFITGWLAEKTYKGLETAYYFMNEHLPALQPRKNAGPSPEMLEAQAALNAIRGKLRNQQPKE